MTDAEKQATIELARIAASALNEATFWRDEALTLAEVVRLLLVGDLSGALAAAARYREELRGAVERWQAVAS